MIRPPVVNGDGTVSIELTKGQWTILDEVDLHLVSQHTWSARERYDGNGFYAAATAGRRMHRVIMGAVPGQLCDHRDRDGLNNRRYNLRIATKSQNAWNSAKVIGEHGRGVSLIKGRFYGRIKAHGVTYGLGGFDTAEEAHEAYLKAARELHGEFALLMHPGEAIPLVGNP